MLAAVEHQSWSQVFQSVVSHHLPPLENTTATSAGAIIALVVGVLLVFRAAKIARHSITVIGFFVGAWIGFRLSLFLGTPAAITCAIVAVVMAAVAYRTYRGWLACGSVVGLFMLATAYQLGQGDPQRFLPNLEDARGAIRDGRITSLAKESEQLQNLHGQWRAELTKSKERVWSELKSFGPRGWLVPALAVIIAAVIAWYALGILAVASLSLMGAVCAVMGGSTLAWIHIEDLRPHIAARPDVLFGVTIGLWLLGIILQAKEARLPKPPPPKPAGKPAGA